MQSETSASSDQPAPYNRYLWFGFSTVFVLILGVGGWGALAPISGAVIAPGVVAVEGKPKTIQHSDGGIVGKILVRDGDRVDVGDVLIRLDATAIRANLAIVESKLHEVLARQARLDAELSDMSEPEPHPDLRQMLHKPSVRDIVHGQHKLFEARLASRDGQVEQIKQRIVQYEEQIEALNLLRMAKVKQAELIDQELASMRTLNDQGHVPKTKVRALELDVARLEGETAEHIAELAQIKGSLAEANIQVQQIQYDFQEKVVLELRDVLASIRELREERHAALDKLGRIELRSPVAGIVHGLNIHTIGGVIAATDPVMQIVPLDDRLIIDSKVEPRSIDQIYLGQNATLRFPAFNQLTTPELEGRVINISADRLEDANSNIAYYQAIIEIPREQLDRLGNLELLPGMPVEGFIKTADRTALNYLVKPLTDQLRRAFRED